jgi:uncharacterized protein YjbI with pentapeptide repeats
LDGAGEWVRKSLEDSWTLLESRGEEMPRDESGRPFVPTSMPSHDDQELGFSFFRTQVTESDYSNLTLPRTFFGRSLLDRVNFGNTDLCESRMCWNDFEGCDFSGADMSGSDMRASNFKGCRFVAATLRGADLRQSSFEDCDFTSADLTGAVANDADFTSCPLDYLSEKQQAAMEWTADSGPDPPGG